jgi:hypothetical protein
VKYTDWPLAGQTSLNKYQPGVTGEYWPVIPGFFATALCQLKVEIYLL